jgi:hypothetical protein
MVTDRAELQDWSRLIRGEYEELADLQLTQSQVEDLWGLDTAAANALLTELVSAGVLRKTHAGAYVRADVR